DRIVSIEACDEIREGARHQPFDCSDERARFNPRFNSRWCVEGWRLVSLDRLEGRWAVRGMPLRSVAKLSSPSWLYRSIERWVWTAPGDVSFGGGVMKLGFLSAIACGLIGIGLAALSPVQAEPAVSPNASLEAEVEKAKR